MIDALHDAAGDTELADFYDLVCEQSGYLRALEDKGDMESRGRLENVQELRSSILAYLENAEGAETSLSGFLDEIAGAHATTPFGGMVEAEIMGRLSTALRRVRGACRIYAPS